MDTPTYEYLVTKQDYNDAERLHRRNRPRAAVVYYVFFWLLPCVSAAYLLYTLIVFGLGGWRAVERHLAEASLALYLAILLPFAFWNAKRRAWNTLQPKKYAGRPVTFQFDGEQLISARPGVSDGRFYWTAIEDFAEDDRMALIYPRPKLFVIVPKRAMPEEAWQRLRAFAVPQKRRKR